MTLQGEGIASIHGGDGDDILNVNSNGQTVDGGNGNDIFNINYSSSAKIKGGDGDDTFYLKENLRNLDINGNSGTNIINGNIDSSMTLVNVDRANAGSVDLAKMKQKH